jgi:hypothetical protein
MNIKAIALVAILGLSAPAITDLAINPQALANEPVSIGPIGGYTDGLWSIAIWREKDIYNYSIKNYQTGSTLFLSDLEETVENDRRIYSWSNGISNYQIVWQPSEPRAVRLIVIAADGREVLDRLLVRQFK